jgi:hypothetical protein
MPVDTWLVYIHDFLTADSLRMVVLGSLIGAMLSVPITWFFSWWFYRKAAEDLRDAADEMKRESQHLRDYLRELVLLESKARKIR